MNIKNQKDFFSGLMFIIVGIAFAFGSITKDIGGEGRMGPGYFPLIVGILLAILGFVITIKSVTIKTEDDGKIEACAWRPLFFIICSNLAFGLILGGLPSINIPPMGLILGIYALVFIASLASKEFKFKEVLILATLLSIISYLAFIVLLKLPFPV